MKYNASKEIEGKGTNYLKSNLILTTWIYMSSNPCDIMIVGYIKDTIDMMSKQPPQSKSNLPMKKYNGCDCISSSLTQ